MAKENKGIYQKKNVRKTNSKKSNGEAKTPSSALRQLEDGLNSIAEFRYNTVFNSPEIRFKSQDKTWQKIDDFTLNTLSRLLKQKDIKFASPGRVAVILSSNFVNKINPIQQYFEALSFQQNSDPIGELASTVTLSDLPHYQDVMFRKYLSKWMTGAVANVFISDRCANHLCLILCGAQGTYKSTWIRNLCPETLKDYYIEGGLDPDNKDSLLETTTNFIFNLDDYFAGMSARKINEFKGLITKNKVKIRRPYNRYPEEMQKICSFVASSNENHFLHDTTGNRRYLAFEIERIDINRALKIPIDEVWAQAYHLFRSGFTYWLTPEDHELLEHNNEHFEVQSVEYELLITYLRPPMDKEKPDALLTNADIQVFLQSKASVTISRKKLGEALAKAGFPKKQKQRNYKRSRVYEVIYTETTDLQIGTLSETR